jgi:hypothetical protein
MLLYDGPWPTQEIKRIIVGERETTIARGKTGQRSYRSDRKH